MEKGNWMNKVSWSVAIHFATVIEYDDKRSDIVEIQPNYSIGEQLSIFEEILIDWSTLVASYCRWKTIQSNTSARQCVVLAECECYYVIVKAINQQTLFASSSFNSSLYSPSAFATAEMSIDSVEYQRNYEPNLTERNLMNSNDNDHVENDCDVNDIQFIPVGLCHYQHQGAVCVCVFLITSRSCLVLQNDCYVCAECFYLSQHHILRTIHEKNICKMMEWTSKSVW